jgi:hypothetical protein
MVALTRTARTAAAIHVLFALGWLAARRASCCAPRSRRRGSARRRFW